MSVKELIEKLSKYNGDLEVERISGSGWDTGLDEINNVEYDSSENKVMIY